jgi:hypothetical protein
LRGRWQDARTSINCESRPPGLGAFCARRGPARGRRRRRASLAASGQSTGE